MWGRFASPDPGSDQHFEETQSWNIYSYVQNNPVMMTDPTGMVTGPGDALNSLIGASTTLSEWWRERVSDPLERLSNKINGNGWVENRDLPNAGGEKAVPVPIIFCGGVVPVGMPMPAINLNLPGPSAPAVVTNGGAVALSPGATVSVPLPIPAVAMTGGPSTNQLQTQQKKGQAPKDVVRVDKAGEQKTGQDHVHFKDGALNRDGTPHDVGKGVPKVSNESWQWLKKWFRL
jgi:hypothetical protein